MYDKSVFNFSPLYFFVVSSSSHTNVKIFLSVLVRENWLKRKRIGKTFVLVRENNTKNFHTSKKNFSDIYSY